MTIASGATAVNLANTYNAPVLVTGTFKANATSKAFVWGTTVKTGTVMAWLAATQLREDQPVPAPTGGVVRVKSVVLEAADYFGNLQWQKSADRSAWADVANATNTSLDVTSLYTNTPWFQVKVTSGTNAPAYSKWMQVTSQATASGTTFLMR
jgi:hypothetical protein